MDANSGTSLETDAVVEPLAPAVVDVPSPEPLAETVAGPAAPIAEVPPAPIAVEAPAAGDGGENGGNGGAGDSRKSPAIQPALPANPSLIRSILERYRPGKNDTGQSADFGQDIVTLRRVLADIVETQQSDDNQGELARIANLLPHAAILDKDGRLCSLALCLDGFHVSPPNAVFISSLRSDCELAVLRSQRGMFRFVYLVSGSTPISATLSGLVFSLFGMLFVGGIVVGLATWLGGNTLIKELAIPWPLFGLMLTLAATGAFVSVLSRLGQLQSNRGYDAFLVFATGFFKPWIGVAFGAFLFFVLNSQLLNIAGLTDLSTGGTKAQSIFGVLAFISGFSERLVSDFITRTGGTMLGPQSSAVPKADPVVH